MYIVSVKSSKLKSVVALIAAVTFLCRGIVYFAQRQNKQNEDDNQQFDLHVQTAQECAAFLSRIDLVVENEPVENKDIIIPESFGEVYERYNALQKEQGFDLTPFSGKAVTQWSFRVLNYPGNETNRDEIRANLLVYEGTVIGGDVSSVAIDGFMKPLNVIQQSASGVDQKVTKPIDP